MENLCKPNDEVPPGSMKNAEGVRVRVDNVLYKDVVAYNCREHWADVRVDGKDERVRGEVDPEWNHVHADH